MKESALNILRTRERLERFSRLIRTSSHAAGLNPAQWEALRYLARANRFSNSPIATSMYLGATKGTISQTIVALTRKGLLQTESRKGDNRSVALALTPAGDQLLKNDPLAALDENLGAIPAKMAKRFAKGIGILLRKESARQEQPEFGSCAKCRYFLAGNNPACTHFGERLDEDDISRLCFGYRRIKRPGKRKAPAGSQTN